MIGKIGRGFTRLRDGLRKTRNQLGDGVRSIVKGRSSFDEGMWEEIEELLLRSDTGAAVAEEIVDELRLASGRWGKPDAEQVFSQLRESIATRLGGEPVPLQLDGGEGPAVVLVIGVNGAGKTTSIGKLAARLSGEGKRVLVVAGDTYRMAAMEQLAVWADRADVPIVKGKEGADAAAVVWDGLEAGVRRGSDVILVDTAGRLHTKSGLMDELVKVRRVIEKRLPGAPHEVLLVLDGTTGQNAIQQARVFGESLGVTGLVLAKLDGTAKGGVVMAIRRELDVPVKLIGVGEKLEDLQDFDPAAFAEALAPSDATPSEAQE
ncbi:MAG: signal recognition particle-docking protein FtsY [Gemmatimonadota bacterium]|nr:MAG: signal recognition particle-docking protein FtsY [Gemmatimonadota bacterium]